MEIKAVIFKKCRFGVDMLGADMRTREEIVLYCPVPEDDIIKYCLDNLKELNITPSNYVISLPVPSKNKEFTEYLNIF